ncbi:MAG: helix-turn-helix transcriptional regulator [Pseudosphingobacterium sp.]|nr:helix-turn-helix transcriptional regulator [Pseudosphingobacterium sp.]
MTDNQREKNKKLKLIRRALRLNQQEMADILGIQRSSLSKIENMEDNRNVPKDAFFILNKKFGLTEDYWERSIEPMFNAQVLDSKPMSTIESISRYSSPEKIIELLERTISDKEAIILEKQKRIELLEHYIETISGTKLDKNAG